VAEQLEQLGEPVLPRMLADDATPEALAGLLARHGSIAILAAESALLDNLAGRYAEGRANLHLVCQAYGGESTSIDRRGREPEHLEHPLLTLGLSVQPHVLRRVTADETMREQGFLARVGFMRPSSRVGSRDIDPPPVGAEIASRYRECVRRIADLRRADKTDTTGDEGGSVGSVSVSLTFSSAAAEAFRDWRAAHEVRLAPVTGDLAPVAAWAGRHPGRVARLAGLLHLAEHEPEQPISAGTFHTAARIGEYLARHPLAALVEDPVRAEAGRAWTWIRSRGESTVSVRDLQRGPGGGRGTAEEWREVAELLERDGRLRRRSDHAPGSAGGRPASPTYDVLSKGLGGEL
jgi:replicative DNA helicase